MKMIEKVIEAFKVAEPVVKIIKAVLHGIEVIVADLKEEAVITQTDENE